MPGRVDAWLQPVRASMPYRAWQRYSAARGNVLAGGIAYFAFFSIFPALAIGFTLFALVLGGQLDLQTQLVQYVNGSLGSTVISYHPGQIGVVNVEQLIQPRVLTTTGVAGGVTLLFTGLGWVAALRDGIQAVFAVRTGRNVVVVKLFDLVLFLGAGAAVLASVVIGIAVNVATGQVLDVLGLARNDASAWLVTVVGQLLLVVLDAVIFTALLHRLCGVAVPWRDVARGGVVAAVGFSLLKFFASELLQVVSRNRFLASFSVIIGLLVWMNLVARLFLLAAAWSATVAADGGRLPTPDPPARSQAGADQEAERRPRSSPLPIVAGFAAGLLAGRLLGRRRARVARRHD